MLGATFPELRALLSLLRSLASPCREHGAWNAPSSAVQPLHGMGAGPGQSCWSLWAGRELPWEHGGSATRKGHTHCSVDRAGARQEQVPHGGRSEGLLVGYFFNIF